MGDFATELVVNGVLVARKVLSAVLLAEAVHGSRSGLYESQRLAFHDHLNLIHPLDAPENDTVTPVAQWIQGPSGLRSFSRARAPLDLHILPSNAD